MSVEPLAALRLWGVLVEIGDAEYTIPPLPAADWVIAVLNAEHEIFPLMAMLSADDYEDLKFRVLIEGAATIEDVATASKDALEVASGWRWWSAETMIHSAAAEWRLIAGEMTKRGLDPSVLPLGAWLNGLYAMATENLKPDERLAFNMRLEKAPVGAITKEEREAQAAQMFAAAMAEAAGPGGLRPPPGTA